MKQFDMDLNRETAMRLWAKHYGKELRVEDFAGRVMVKSAYGDRNSDYGWNVDHILPQSKGGATADHNLVCCHINTNDEKADRFPAFVANGIRFEIIKVENHYEIRRRDGKEKEQKQEEEVVDFLDSAAGVRLFKKFKGIQNKTLWVGSVLIVLKKLEQTAVVEFIKELFEEEHLSFYYDSYSDQTRILIQDFDMPLQSDISGMLYKCAIINTYLSEYFVPLEYVNSYAIYYQANCYKDGERFDMFVKESNPLFSDTLRTNAFSLNKTEYSTRELPNTMFINHLVWHNTEAGKDKNVHLESNLWAHCHYVFPKLAKNLRKEVGEK